MLHKIYMWFHILVSNRLINDSLKYKEWIIHTFPNSQSLYRPLIYRSKKDAFEESVIG